MIKINLLPEKDLGLLERFIEDLVIGVFIISVVSISCYVWGKDLNDKIILLDSQINQKNSRIRELESVIKQVESFKANKDKLEQQIGVIEKLHKEKTGPVNMLKEFAMLVPEDLWITQFKENGVNPGPNIMPQSVDIAGFSFDPVKVSDFVDNLKSSQYFSNIQIQTVERNTDSAKVDKFGLEQTQVSFSISCEVKYL